MISRKKTQIAEREKEIIRIAGDILTRDGFGALTMERVLAEVQFSKGTLYNHFTCREDLLVAHHAQTFAEYYELFARGALFRGRPRERFVAVGVGDVIKHDIDPCPVKMVMTDSILEAASERWREAFVSTLRETVGVFVGIVRDGIAAGDLDPEHDPEQVAASAWAIWVGAEELRGAGMIFRDKSDEEFEDRRELMMTTLLDGYGWKPLSSEHDYDAVKQRIVAEIYRPEAEKLGMVTPAKR